MKHGRFTFGNLCYILTGNCITIYNTNGEKLEHKFFVDWESAWLEFSELYTSLVA